MAEDLEMMRHYTRPEVQKRLRRDAMSYEARHYNTLKERERRVRTRSLDMPNSRESRIEIADHSQAAKIRACNWRKFFGFLMPIINDRPKADYDFYSQRMRWAIEFIADRRGYNHKSDEFKKFAAFLWMVWQNWRSGKADETIAALGLNPATYKWRIWRLTRDFESPDWAAYLVTCAIGYAIRQRIEDERRDTGGILHVQFTA